MKRTKVVKDVEWAKVSWCEMTRGDGKGSRWKITRRRRRRKRKRGTKQPGDLFKEVMDRGRPVCTWVKKGVLPIAVLSALQDGAASARRLLSLMQHQRQLTVAALAHPATTQTVAVVTSFFRVSPESDVPTESVRICTSDYSDDERSDHTQSPSSPSPTKRKRHDVREGLRVCPRHGFAHDFDWFVNEYGEDEGEDLWREAEVADFGSDVDDTDVVPIAIPSFEEARIDNIMKDINKARLRVPRPLKRMEVIAEYNALMRKPGWNTSTHKKHFPLTRFQRHLDTEFPESKNMCVSEDRLQWVCVLCPGSGQNLRIGGEYHKQNSTKHFRSKEHCARVASNVQTSEAVEIAVNHVREAKIYTNDVPMAIMDDAVVSCARKSLSFTAVPVVMQVAARAIIVCRGKEPISNEEIIKVRQVSKLGASVLQRVNAAVKAQVVRGGRSRPACVRSASWVTNRMLELAKITVKKKTDFLLTCPYLSVSCDESDTYSSSAPLAAALQGCSWDFNWANLFMGQTDVSEDKSGEGCFKKLRDLLNGVDSRLLPLVIFFCTDGASAMRSTPLYAGLDSNPNGISLHAFLKRLLTDKLPNLHGLCHQGDLAMKKALKICCKWSDLWLEHIKAMYRWFSKSPSRKSALKKLHKEMELLQDVVTWRMVYPKYYCPTRWLGISRALKSILAAQDLLESYVDTLVDDGFRPYRGEDEDPPVQAVNAREEEHNDDDDEDNRVHSASFHKWGDDPWDLRVSTPDGDVEIVDEDERLEMETGRAMIWKDLPTGNKRTNCKLLSEKIGLTAFMCGIDSIMADALHPYKMLTERLQTQVVPIGHRVRRWVSTMFNDLHQRFLCDAPSYGDHFQRWILRDDVNETMANQVRAMGRSFVYHFLDNFRYRFQPYWKTILAMETINPCAPAKLSLNAWDGVKDLVNRCMPGVEPTAVVQELKNQHQATENWCLAEVKSCTSNLLRYYHDRLKSFKNNNKTSTYPLAERFARLVFSFHLTSSVIETYFSKTKYIKNLHRASMRDSLSSATLHLQQLRGYVDDEVIEIFSSLGIDLESALQRLESDLDDLREKYVSAKIAKPFMDNVRGEVRPYKGTVTDVHYSNSDGCYLFHVNYDSDSDDEDMEHWELKKYVQ